MYMGQYLSTLERITLDKFHFKINTQLCNMDNQTDSNDATWI